jgi:hypothetical protein
MSMIVTLFILGLANLGCSKSDSESSADAGAPQSDATASAFPGEGPADAVKAVGAELDQHWVKTSEGWISEYRVPDSLDKEVDVFVELKDPKFEIGSKDTSSDADKQRGVEYGTMGALYFSQLRVFKPDPANANSPGKWSPWKEPQDVTEFSVFKQNGAWQIADWDNFKPGGTFQAGDAMLSPRDVPFRGIGIANGARPDSAVLAKLQ